MFETTFATITMDQAAGVHGGVDLRQFATATGIGATQGALTAGLAGASIGAIGGTAPGALIGGAVGAGIGGVGGAVFGGVQNLGQQLRWW